jgi:hypothetical protein
MTSSQYTHACDASAASLLNTRRLFAAASDEGSVLRVYDLDHPGAPVSSLDVTAFLEPDTPSDTEADVEGSAPIGDRIYWIGSHGRNKNGKERKFRQRLFATDIVRTGADVTLRPAGRPYTSLLRDLSNSPALSMFGIATAAGLAPEAVGGLNIEGMAPTADEAVLIGFRNPIPDAHALVVRIANPAALVEGTAERAEVSLAGLIALGGRGIRALEWLPQRRVYLVLAGAFDNSGNFALFSWAGVPDAPAIRIPLPMGDLNPEELIVTEGPDGVALHLLSDDGTDECKAADMEARHYRASTFALEL